MATQKNKNLLFWMRGHKFLSIIFLLIVLVAAVFSVQAYQKYQNKLAFQQARSAIDFIYGDIVAKVGRPADSKTINNCSRHHQEFTEGPLSCAVGTSFIYAVADRNEATQEYKAIQNVIKSRPGLFKPDGPLSSEITDELVINSYYHSAYDKFHTLKGMSCSTKYIYDTPEETFLSINQDKAKTLQINMACSEWAKQQIYPLQS